MAGFQLKRLGMVMEPQASNPLEAKVRISPVEYLLLQFFSCAL